MGGVYTFTDDDPAVIFYNPAGLSNIKGINWRIFDLNLGINGLQIANDLSAIGTINGLSSLNSLYGKNIWVGTDGYSSIVMPYFGFAVLDNGFASLRLDNPIFPNLGIDFYNNYGFEVGGSVPLGFGSLGLAVKRLVRKGGHQDIGPSLLTSISNSTLQSQFANEGIGYGMDAGLLIAPPAPLNPVVSISWLDVGSTAFVKSAGTDAPERIKDNVVLNTSISSSLPGLGFATGLEYRHITDQGEPLGKKLHLGVELTLLNLDVRAGFYQGYTTYGVGVDLLLFQLDAAMYTVEKGAYPGQTPDQRIEVSLSMDLGFDPNFKLTDAGGKKRKLKQRR
jgi:hypothetical protein